MSGGQCTGCGATLKPGHRFCTVCGETIAAPSSGQDLGNAALAVLASFAGLAALSHYTERRLWSTAGTMTLLVSGISMLYAFREALGKGLRALERSWLMRPWWVLRDLLPRPVQVVAGIAVPSALVFNLAPFLVKKVSESGFFVALVCLAVSTVVAHMFLAPATGVRR